MATATKVTLTGYTHVAISVTDLEAARAFYIDGLGFEELPRPNFGVDGMWLRVGSHQLHFGVVDEMPPKGPGFPHFALHVPREEYDATIDALRERGIEVVIGPNQREDFGVLVRAAFIADPSGNMIELTDVPPF